MTPPPPTLVAAVEVKVAGQPLDPSLNERLLEARVQDNIMLPNTFFLRFRDPDFKLVDGSLFDIGAKIEVRFSAIGPGPPADPFKGEVTTIAPQFESEGCVIVVRGYDVSHRLNRGRKTRTFQDLTASDIAKKVVGENGLSADVTATSEVYAFEQQSNESDWDFLWRIAARVGYEIACVDGKIHFREPGASPGQPVKLEWGQDLRAFHPRATGVGQVEKVVVGGWDPKGKRRLSQTASTALLDSKIGLQRNGASSDLGGGETAVSDQIVVTEGEAKVLAQSTLDHLANAWLEAEGVSRGNPKIRAGSRVTITGVGSRFGGDYLVTKATHVMRGAKGYETEFEISGRSRRTLVDLLTPTPRRGYAESLVIGIVTNNDDPEKMGRVRVKFPGLDENREGWWARIASTAATADRGLMMMPLVDDEVVVGFEHGDARRPFVLGALWNGVGKPGKLASAGGKPDGSFNVNSTAKASIASTKDMAIATEAKFETKSTGDFTLQTQGKFAIKGDGAEISIAGPGGSVVIKQDGSITVKGTQVTVDASGKLALSSSGVVQIKGSQVMIG